MEEPLETVPRDMSLRSVSNVDGGIRGGGTGDGLATLPREQNSLSLPRPNSFLLYLLK